MCESARRTTYSTSARARGVILANGGFEWDPGAGRGVPARPDARPGVAAEQHRRRAADGDGARRRPGQHGRGMVGAGHPDPRGHHRRAPAQPQCPPGAHPAPQHHRQPGGQAVPQRGLRLQLDGRRFPLPRPATATSTIPAWIVFDDQHLKRYGFLGVEPDGQVPDWFCQSRDLAELGEKTGIDADGLARTLRAWNDNVAT